MLAEGLALTVIFQSFKLIRNQICSNNDIYGQVNHLSSRNQLFNGCR